MGFRKNRAGRRSAALEEQDRQVYSMPVEATSVREVMEAWVQKGQ